MGWRQALSAFGRNASGHVAVIVAIAVPVLALLTCGTVDLASLSADHTAMQDVADATALAAAKQLGLGDPNTTAQRAQAYANSMMAGVGKRVAYTVSAAPSADGSSITVKIDGTRPSFFGNLLPPGGWAIHVQATAVTLGQAPLCVLSWGADKHADITLADTSRMTAPACLVQSNGDMTAKNSSLMQAQIAQASGVATGNIQPSPQQGAPAIDDPFAGMNLAPPLSLCSPLDVLYDVGTNVLPPGIHCGNIKVAKGATLTLLPGEHYFLKGKLELKDTSVLSGSDVVLVFDKDSDFKFDDKSQISLEGRRTGAFAGFVIVTTRANVGTFEISSDSARQLLGTIYIPSATLQVTGSGNRVADQSAWTVVVAKSIQLTGSPNLVINANYATSSVPVPSGVGPAATQVTLKQ